jgi:two-component system LytT family sensor kinase
VKLKTHHSILSGSKQNKQLQFLQFRLAPYFIIVLFSIAITFVRVYMIPEWGPLIQTGLFFIQVIMLTIIWHIVKGLNNFLDKKIPFEKGPVTRIALQVALTMCIVAPVFTTIALVIRPHLPEFITHQFVAIGIVLFTVVILLFNFGFYSYYFFKQWQDSVEDKAELQVQAADLEREKFMLQYHQLRNQVNPHYLFNTLTSLDGLIQTNPELASEFVRHMSKVYRYVLQHKESEVVSLDEELEFIEHYMQLLHIRYENSLNIHYKVSSSAKEKGIVMVTLQMLIDNAIKHNIVQKDQPLNIVIWDEHEYLVVYNNKQLRKQIETSNSQGLKQLVQLYSYLTAKPVIVEDNHEHFTLKLPLL